MPPPQDDLCEIRGHSRPPPAPAVRARNGRGRRQAPSAQPRQRRKELVMTNVVYPPATREIGARRRELAPAIHQAFDAFSKQAFADGALPGKAKQLIAVAVAHVTQCPYCIAATPSSPTGPARPMKRSWKRSGSQPRCGRAAPSPIPRWRCTLSAKSGSNDTPSTWPDRTPAVTASRRSGGAPGKGAGRGCRRRSPPRSLIVRAGIATIWPVPCHATGRTSLTVRAGPPWQAPRRPGGRPS